MEGKQNKARTLEGPVQSGQPEAEKPAKHYAQFSDAGMRISVACWMYDDGTYYASGFEENEEQEFCYFCFVGRIDKFAGDEESFRRLLEDNEANGFCEGWYCEIGDLISAHSDDEVLMYLTASLGLKQTGRMQITLDFSGENIAWLKTKFDIESKNDLMQAVWECISTYMEM